MRRAVGRGVVHNGAPTPFRIAPTGSTTTKAVKCPLIRGTSNWGPRLLLSLSLLGCLYFALAARAWWSDNRWGPRGLLVAVGVLSFLVHKTGVGVGQRHLLDCLALDPGGESCYWQLRHLPYASWTDPGDLLAMLTHRSTLVEATAALLMLQLLRRAPTTGSDR